MVHRSLSVQYHSPVVSISKYHLPWLAAECHPSIQSEKVREGILPRTNQQSSFTGCRWNHAAFPPARLWHAPSSFFICPLLLPPLSPNRPFTSSFSLLFFFKLQSLCSTWHPKLCLLNVFLSWQDSAVVWQFLSTFILKWVSGMLPLQELFHDQHFSQKNDHLLVPCTLLCRQRAVGWVCSSWKVVALVRGVEPSVLGGLPRLLYLWPLIINIHTYVATRISTVLTFQKIAICLQVCLVLGHHHHQNGRPGNMPGAFLMAFWTGSLGTLKAWCIPTSATWFIPQCYVPQNVFLFTVPNGKSSVNGSA